METVPLEFLEVPEGSLALGNSVGESPLSNIPLAYLTLVLDFVNLVSFRNYLRLVNCVHTLSLKHPLSRLDCFNSEEMATRQSLSSWVLILEKKSW